MMRERIYLYDYLSSDDMGKVSGLPIDYQTISMDTHIVNGGLIFPTFGGLKFLTFI